MRKLLVIGFVGSLQISLSAHALNLHLLCEDVYKSNPAQSQSNALAVVPTKPKTVNWAQEVKSMPRVELLRHALMGDFSSTLLSAKQRKVYNQILNKMDMSRTPEGRVKIREIELAKIEARQQPVAKSSGRSSGFPTSRGESKSSSGSSYGGYGGYGSYGGYKPSAETKLKALGILNSLNQHAKDFVFESYLRGIGSFKLASVLIGNADHSVREQDKQIFEHVLLNKLKNDGKMVIYDADAASADWIRSIMGESAIGISGRAEDLSKNIIYIENPYVRMQMFAWPAKIYSDQQSLVGSGLIVDGKSVEYVTPESKSDIFNAWVKQMPVVGSLGVKTSFGGGRVRSISDVTVFKGFQTAPEVKLSNDSIAEGTTSLYSVDESARKMETGIREMAVSSAGTLVPGGAVIFGSSRPDPRWVNLVYDIGYVLGENGITVVTGGSGGYMEAANAGAYNAGSYSIGVPLGGFSLKGERRIADEYQTHTISSSGYETRIPLLLNKREMVILVPGGGGTMKELATTFVQMAAQGQASPVLVLVAKDYYHGLYQEIQNSNLPESLKHKVFLVDSKQEMQELINQMDSKVSSVSNWRTQKPQPRLQTTSTPSSKSVSKSSVQPAPVIVPPAQPSRDSRYKDLDPLSDDTYWFLGSGE